MLRILPTPQLLPTPILAATGAGRPGPWPDWDFGEERCSVPPANPSVETAPALAAAALRQPLWQGRPGQVDRHRSFENSTKEEASPHRSLFSVSRQRLIATGICGTFLTN